MTQTKNPSWKWPPDVQAALDAHFKTAPKIHFSETQLFLPDELQATTVNAIYDAIKSTGIREAQALNAPTVYRFHNASEQVYQKYGIPYPLYGYQSAWVDAFANTDAAGMYFEVGAGKTATATVAALFHRLHHPGHTLVVMPPILIPQWYKWLTSIEGINSVLMYRGTPAQREALSLDAEFVLMSMDIFKRDFDYIYTFFEHKNATLIVDEAVCVKNPSTQNHKCVWAFQNLDCRKLPRRPKTASQSGQPARRKMDSAALADLNQKLKALRR